MSYGVDTDVLGFADTNIKFVGTSEDASKSEAQCLDSNGDVNESTMYDSTTSKSHTYKSCGNDTIVFYDTATAKDFRIGKVISGQVITSIAVATGNSQRPDIVFNTESCSEADSAVSKYDPSDLEVLGTRKAHAIGATVDTNSKLTGSSATVSANVVKELDSTGSECGKDVHGARVEATNDYTGCSGEPGAAAADSTWTISSGPSKSKSNTEYATGSITVFKNLAKM